jgi:hypothetical protein
LTISWARVKPPVQDERLDGGWTGNTLQLGSNSLTLRVSSVFVFTTYLNNHH